MPLARVVGARTDSTRVSATTREAWPISAHAQLDSTHTKTYKSIFLVLVSVLDCVESSH